MSNVRRQTADGRRETQGARRKAHGFKDRVFYALRFALYHYRLPFVVCLLLAVLFILLSSVSVCLAQADDARPFTALRRETYRVASGLFRVETPIPAWDSRDSLTVAPGARLWRLRSFEAGGTAYALCVNVETLKACVVQEEDVKSVGGVNVPEALASSETSQTSHTALPGGNGVEGISEVCRLGEGGQGSGGAEETPYGRALMRHARAPMMDEGKKGLVLTVDLCPSHRAWDRDLFDALREMRSGEKPLPVAVCISGAWVRHHSADFEQLLTWHREGALEVTFVNHSDTHPVGERGDFLNNAGVDFEAEVLNAEVTLLMHGAVPSPFFRFPGLVHSTARLEALARYGLIPVDADHWPGRDHLATDRVPEGILLIHGNGNERAGVAWFFEMIRRTGMKEKLRDGAGRVISLAECARAE